MLTWTAPMVVTVVDCNGTHVDSNDKTRSWKFGGRSRDIFGRTLACLLEDVLFVLEPSL